MMGFKDAVLTCLRNYVTFSGRASRPEYWWFILAAGLAVFAGSFLDVLLGTGTLDGGIVNALVLLGLLLPSLSVTWRRLHDTGRPGWYLPAVLAAIPLVSAMAALAGGNGPFATGVMLVAFFGGHALLLWWLASPSQPGGNAYGPAPTATHDRT